jgi:cyclopropane fatty-acyl-phospholipid synthase-like methyltransferase
MDDAASSARALDDTSARERKRPASKHTEAGRTHWLSVIFWLLEQRWFVLLAIPTTLAGAVTLATGGGIVGFVLTWILVPLTGIGIPLLLIVYRSRRHDGGPANWEPYVAFRDAADAKRWAGRKIPMEIVYEAYLAGKLDFEQDVREVMLRRNRIFRFCFTFGDLRFYVAKFLRQKLRHSLRADREDVAPNYDRGNDFYRWFLGDSMVYTSGLFQDPEETLEVAQARKLETVCRYVQMQPGDRHLDIGCGWGGLLAHAARQHGTHSTGVTLSKEQASWARELAVTEGLGDRVRVLVDDYRNLPSERFDKITCLEMAEHVGIRNFQKFLLQVRHMLEDDGIFYLQIAGLRRPWQYEDLVWGLFMGKYIFPGADASCPLAFVVSQAERAGFEVHPSRQPRTPWPGSARSRPRTTRGQSGLSGSASSSARTPPSSTPFRADGSCARTCSGPPGTSRCPPTSAGCSSSPRRESARSWHPTTESSRSTPSSFDAATPR